jgi:leucyl-tRNA synthetase
MTRQVAKQTNQARSLRATQTPAEGLLWSVLRGKQLCNLKFRRQHRIGPFFADFACVSRKVIVELDGEYHDSTAQKDLDRQRFLVSKGWRVVRFTNEDVLRDVESVLRAIASSVDVDFQHQRRSNHLGGMLSDIDPNQPPHPAEGTDAKRWSASDLPAARGGEDV